MAKKKFPQPPGGAAVRQSAALQELLEELQSPEEHVRAQAVRQLCPCRTAWDIPVQRYLAEMRDDPSSQVRHEVHHVLDEDSRWGKKLEQNRVRDAVEECSLDVADPASMSIAWFRRSKPLRKRGYYPQRRNLNYLLDDPARRIR